MNIHPSKVEILKTGLYDLYDILNPQEDYTNVTLDEAYKVLLAINDSVKNEVLALIAVAEDDSLDAWHSTADAVESDRS